MAAGVLVLTRRGGPGPAWTRHFIDRTDGRHRTGAGDTPTQASVAAASGGPGPQGRVETKATASHAPELEADEAMPGLVEMTEEEALNFWGR